MPAANRLLTFTAFAILATLALPCVASAQCMLGLPDAQGISTEGGNPFQAEYSSQMVLASPATTALVPQQGTRSVARDSQGRVRMDMFLGKYRTKSPDGATNEVERHYISICDPVTKKSIQLDTVSKTATIREFLSTPVPPNPPPNETQQSFCTRYFSLRRHFQETGSEDLGYRLIDSFNAHGVRTMLVSQASQKGVLKSVEAYTEEWCSDELGAVLLKVFATGVGSGHRRETGFANIVRGEPDASLFEIPPDYTVVERATEGNRPVLGRPMLRPMPQPAESNKPQ